ncbi:MAG: hypothetical protein HC861_06455 [Rhodospirillaceae bacterium]|nr:hypothetical protein [Rhodospirillaceae bacterium]
MRSMPRLVLCNIVAGLCMALATAAMAQSETNPPPLTEERAKDFLTAAGLQTCEISEIDPMVTRIHGATKSLSIGVAKDCARYDPANPTVVNVHQFADEQRRDAMVVALQDLRFRRSGRTPTSGRWRISSSSCSAPTGTRSRR